MLTQQNNTASSWHYVLFFYTLDTRNLGRSDDLVDRIREEAKFRGKVASGRTLASLRTTVLASDTFLVATLSGADNWKYWGNGRGPGRMPPVGPLARWIANKGLSMSAWALA